MKEKFVICSLNNFDESKCVDFFQRKDKSFGYQEYRRDKETHSGWYKVDCSENLNFQSKEEAYKNALKNIVWIKIEEERK